MVVKNADVYHGIRIRKNNHQLNKQILQMFCGTLGDSYWHYQVVEYKNYQLNRIQDTCVDKRQLVGSASYKSPCDPVERLGRVQGFPKAHEVALNG